MPTAEHTTYTRRLLAAMIFLHVLWLVTLWPAGPASARQKLPWVLLYSLICGAVVSALPARAVFRARQFTAQLVHNEKLLFMVLGVGTGGAGAVYAYYQSVLLPDEVYSLDAARIIAKQGAASFLADYKRIPWLGSNHPPLVPFVYGFIMQAVGTHIFAIRLLCVALGVATVLLTYGLGKELYGRDTGLWAALLLLSFLLFLRMGAAALTDMPVTFFFTLALLLALHLIRTPRSGLAIALGLSVGAGLLSKYTMVLIYPIVLGIFAFSGEFRRFALSLGIAVLVSVGILGAWGAYAYHKGILAGQLHTLTFYAGQVTTTRSGRQWMFTSLLTSVLPAFGVYNLPLLFVGGWSLLRRRNPANLFILTWIVSVFLFLLLTLPDPRYFLLAFPALAVMAAGAFRHLPEAAEQAVMLALLLCSDTLYLAADWYRITHLFLR